MVELAAKQLVCERAELARAVALHLLWRQTQAEQPPVERRRAALAVSRS